MLKSKVAYGAALGLLFSLGAVAPASSGEAPPLAAQPPAQTAPAPDPVAQRNRIRADESVRRGVLPNGMRYAVMRNATPKGGVSIRLGVDVGSYEETDQERGVAHFVEHMAFNGTRNVPEDQIEKLFAPMGVAFGRDLNASTDYETTVYQLDLPDSGTEPRAVALRWLRDVADGMNFDPAAVVRERGVVRAEADGRDGPATRAWLAATAFHGPKLRSTARDPIGTPQSVATVTPERLRGFYDRWYRPEHAVAVMVGDLPVETMEAELKAAFDSWKGRGAAPTRADRAGPDARRGLEALTVTEPHLATLLSVCRMHDAEPALDEATAWRRDISRGIWRAVLDRRLGALPERADAAMAGAGTQIDDGPDAFAACLGVTPLDENWKAALGAVQAELRRFAADGPTEREFETAIEEIRSRHRGAVSETATRASPRLAEDLLVAELDGESFVTPREALRQFNLAAEELTPAAVKTAFERDWSGGGPLIVLTTPEPPATAVLADAWRAGEAAPALAKYEDAKVATWAYGSFGPAGKVDKRETFAAGDFVRLRFHNGLVVNFKHTDFQQEGVQVRLRMGAGRRELGGMNLTTASLGVGMVPNGGLGRHSAEDLHAMFGTSAWGAELDFDYDGFVFHGESNRSGLEVQLAVLAAFVSDPGFRDTVDRVLPTAVEATYRSYAAMPALAAGDALSRAVSPGSPAVLPAKDEIMKLRTRDVAAYMKPILTQAPLELSIVGDVSEAEVIRVVSKSLGALPARKPVERTGKEAWFMRYPEAPIAPIRVEHEGPADQGLALVQWPLYVATPERRKEEYALSVLAEILSSELRLRIRERLGVTYAPEAGTEMPDHADQGTLTAMVEARPGDLDAVLGEIRAAAADLAAGRITADQLNAARVPMLAENRADRNSNGLWVAVLDGSVSNDQGIKDVLEYADIIGALTVEDLRKAAATWLSRPPIVVTAVPHAPSSTVTASH